MTGKNNKVDIDDAQPDMALAEPILDARGEVLLPAGTVLTESVIASLHRRGVDHLIVVGDPVSEEELAAERARVRERLERLFRRCGTNSNAAPLFKFVQSYRTGEAS